MSNSIERRFLKLKAKLPNQNNKIIKEVRFEPYDDGVAIKVPPDRHKLTPFQIREARKRWFNQKGCSICGTRFKSDKDKHIDHCHITGVIRGQICFACNMALGHFKDDITVVKSALSYLEKFKFNLDLVDQDVWSKE